MSNWDAPSWVLVITAIGGAMVMIINSWNASRAAYRAAEAAARAAVVAESTDKKADAITKKADAITEKADALIVKTAEIGTQTNGQLSSMTKALAVANEKIMGLEGMVAAMVQKRKDDAEA